MRRIEEPKWVNVKQLFGEKNGFQFVIPVYQRDYVWKPEEQVKRLLEDLQNILKTDETHFLGIILDYLEFTGMSNTLHFFVVDGQQRLTTLFLIIIALHEKAVKEKDEDAIDALEDCLYVSPKKGKEAGFKIEPLMNGNNAFNKIAGGDIDLLTTEEKDSNLYEAYLYIKDYIADELIDYNNAELIDGLQRLLIVDIPLCSSDNPQQIFESINSLGCDLSPADLIRNFVLMQCEDGTKRSTYNDQWLPFENKFKDEKDFSSFFRHFLQSKKEAFVNSKAIYDEFRTWFMKEKTNKSICDILKDLTKYAEYFNDLFYEKIESFSKDGLWKAMLDYRNIKSTMLIPFTLEMMRLFRNNAITAKQFKAVLEIIDSFMVRRAIIGMDTSGISRFFCTLLGRVNAYIEGDYSKLVDAVTYCVINENMDKASRFPTDKEIIEKLHMQNSYDYGDALHCFFDKFENEKMEVGSVQKTLGLQIEHIMPQDGSKWLSEVNLTQEEYDVQKMRLGNLTLTTKHDNPKMSNNLFEYKKEILKGTGHFRLNVDVYNAPKWDADEIENRNNDLVKEFLRLYPTVSCNFVSEFEEKKLQFSKSRSSAASRNAYCKKVWEIVNGLVEEKGLFESKDNGTKAYYDFNIFRTYHYFIDFWGYKDGLVKVGIWFSNSKDPNFAIFTDNMDKLSLGSIKYQALANDGNRRGCICRLIPFVKSNDDHFEEFVNSLVDEVYRIHDICDDMYIEGLGRKSDKTVKFFSNSMQDEIEIYCDESGQKILKGKYLGRDLNSDETLNAISAYCLENNINLDDNLSLSINNVFRYLSDVDKTNNWIQPVNPEYYDVDGAFEELGCIDFKQNSKNIVEGSYVYLYAGLPVQRIIYKCIVTKANMANREVNDDKFVLKGAPVSGGIYMKLQPVQHYDEEGLDLDKLMDNGFRSYQGLSRTSKRLDDYLNKFNN